MSAPLATDWDEDIAIGVGGDGQLSSECLPPIRSAAELLSNPPPKPPEIVEGLLHQSCKMVVGGASKSNKTWVLLDLAISVAAGAPWWGFLTKPGRVLYVNLELGAAFFAERIKSVAAAKNVDPSETLDVWNLRGHAADFDELLPKIIQRAGQQYSLIVLDPTYKLLGRRDENRAGDIASLLNGVERLAVETGAAIAFGAHFSKGNQAGKESMDRIGGSGVFARDPDTILTMTRHEQDGAFTVEPILRNHAPIKPFVIDWDFPLMKRDDNLDPTKLKQPKFGRASKYKVDDLVVQLAAQPHKSGRKKAKAAAGLPTGAFQRRVCEEIGMSRGKFYELLKEGEKQHRFKKEGDLWQPVQKVQEVQSDPRTDQ